MADQKVHLKPPPSADPVVSRPLRTGARFTLVLPKKRIVYRHWDKEKYLPGEEAQMVLEGEGLGNEKYEFILERSSASAKDGWTTVATLQADVQGDKATAKYTFPKVPPGGQLTRAEWKRRRAAPGDSLGLHVEATNYEGGFLSIHVEKEQPDGSWDVCTRWQGTIEHGKYDSVFPIPPGKPKRERSTASIVALDFEDVPQEGRDAWMFARTQGLDGSQLEFILERADAEGHWVEVGSAVSVVKGGSARNAVPVTPKPAAGAEPAGDCSEPVRFTRAVVGGDEDLVVSVDEEWLRGSGFEVTLERRDVEAGGDWEEAGAVLPEPAAEGEEGAEETEHWDVEYSQQPSSDAHAAPVEEAASEDADSTDRDEDAASDDRDEDSAQDGDESSAGADDEGGFEAEVTESSEDAPPAKTPPAPGGDGPAPTTPVAAAPGPAAPPPEGSTTSPPPEGSTTTSPPAPVPAGTAADPAQEPRDVPSRTTDPRRGPRPSAPPAPGRSPPAAPPPAPPSSASSPSEPSPSAPVVAGSSVAIAVGTAAAANAAGAAAASSAAGAAVSSGGSAAAAGLADSSSAAGLADSASAGSALGDAGEGGGRSLSDLLSDAKDAGSDVEDAEERVDEAKKEVESGDGEAVAGVAAASATRRVGEIPAADEFAHAAGLRRDPRSLSDVATEATDTKSNLEDLAADAKRTADDADREHGHGDDPNIEE